MKNEIEAWMPSSTGVYCPIWADRCECDNYGIWARFHVRDVVQRLRWIPPGQFLMGSPDDEEERWKDESLQHEVTIENGFWMFDTPCTQALWEAVMDQNPSHFRNPNQPVEQVNWYHVQDFMARIASIVPGLLLRLPTEEQWEYACRAGSTAACYGKPDQIAWYEENSGDKTHPVGMKQPNSWGLYDMLGNVDEWCASEWIDGYNEKRKGILRVIRGGWFGSLRDVRAASCLFQQPSDSSCATGFRCVTSNKGAS